MFRKPVIVGFGFLLVTSAIQAAGARPAKIPDSSSNPAANQDRQALERYNRGLKHIEDGDQALARAAETQDAEERAKLGERARSSWAAAIEELEAATAAKPKLYQAWSSLGYARRKSGLKDAALVAYDRALIIQPDYTPAIEYRAEAYLGVGRLEDARQAYLRLFEIDRPRADQLLEAIGRWLKSPPIDAVSACGQELEGFAVWFEERKAIASKTPAAPSSSEPARW